MATISFTDLPILTVFIIMAEDRQRISADDDNAPELADALTGLIATIKSAKLAPTLSLSLELSDEEAEAARDVLWHCHNASRYRENDADSGDYIFPGQVVIDPEEAPDPLTAQIPLTEKEAQILATLVFNATTADHAGLTRDVAVTLLEKLRQAVFR